MGKCGNCEFKRKLRRTNYYKCEKYNKIITSHPPMKLDECEKIEVK